MHDPMTVAFEIRRPWPEKRRMPGGWRFWPSLATIWHVDPEKDGTDDSCGWFKRARHGDQKVLATIRSEFAFNWDADWGGWFSTAGDPLMSTPGIVLAMFRTAAYNHFGRSRRAADRFTRRHLMDILSFAENTVDSMHSAITQKYGPSPREDRIKDAAEIVYGCVLRWSQPWYRHARWHVWHWQIQIRVIDNIKRRLFSRCEACGRHFPWGYAPMSYQWHSGGPSWFRAERGVYHHGCEPSQMPMSGQLYAAEPIATATGK